jgi:hypothetical protein
MTIRKSVLITSLTLFFLGGNAFSKTGFEDAKPPGKKKAPDRSATIPVCIDEIDRQIAAANQVEAPPDHSGQGRMHTHRKTDVESLKKIKGHLQETSVDPAEFEKQIVAAIARYPDLKKTLDELKSVPVPLNFVAGGSGECRGAGGLYFPPPKNKITLCVTGKQLVGEVIQTLYHETIHALQHNNGDLGRLTKYHSTHGELSTPSRDFTMDPKYYDFDSKIRAEQPAMREALSEFQAEVQELEQSLSEVEKYFYVDVGQDGVGFRPKQKDGLDFATKRIATIPKENSMRFSIWAPHWAKAIGLPKVPEKNARLPENFWTLTYDYLEKLRSRYLELQKRMPQRKADTLEKLFKQYYSDENRFLPHIGNYCTEMQANLDSELRKMLMDRKLKAVGGACGSLVPEQNTKYPELYRENAHPPESDSELVRIALGIAESTVMGAHLYGGQFHHEKGFYVAPEIFNPKNCQKFRDDLLKAKP